MIRQEDLVKIGEIKKTHGIKGEMSFHFTNDSFDESECPFLIVELDAILVPFLLKECRFSSNTTALILLKNVESEEKARTLIGKTVYFSKKHIRNDISEDSFTWDYFIHYAIIDEKAGKIGMIENVDDSTMNVLFIVKDKNDNELLIPASDQFITRIDEDNNELFMQLPEGLLSLSSFIEPI